MRLRRVSLQASHGVFVTTLAFRASLPSTATAANACAVPVSLELSLLIYEKNSTCYLKFIIVFALYEASFLFFSLPADQKASYTTLTYGYSVQGYGMARVLSPGIGNCITPGQPKH